MTDGTEPTPGEEAAAAGDSPPAEAVPGEPVAGEPAPAGEPPAGEHFASAPATPDPAGEPDQGAGTTPPGPTPDFPPAPSGTPLSPPPLATTGWTAAPSGGVGDGGAAAVGALAARGAASRPPRSPLAAVVAALLVAFLGVTALLGAAQPGATAATAARVDLTGGCAGTGTSLAKNGATIQVAKAPSPSAGPRHPFVVEYNGKVPYSGTSSAVITDHKWEVSVYKIKVKSGGSANSSRLTSTSGKAKVGDYLPFKLTGLFYVSGSIKGTGGACAGDVWVLLAGHPVGSVLWIAGLVLMVIGVLLLAFRRPSFRPPGAPRRYKRRPVTGLIGGLVGGAGFSLFLMSYAKVPYGVNTPIVVTAVLAVLGLLWGLIGPRRGRRTALVPMR